MTSVHPQSARVLIVEDSASVRRLLVHVVEADPRLELVGAVESAEDALRLLPTLRPDVISMDIHLPGMDGLSATREIMAHFPTPIVIVSDACDHPEARYSMQALRSGALAIVEKPRAPTNDAARQSARKLATQLAIMSKVPVIRRRLEVGLSADIAPAPRRASAVPCTLVVMAASTGGPAAFERVLSGLGADFPLPVVIVQHMGSSFMEGFAAWLGGVVPLKVVIARDGDIFMPGHVYVAPGEGHLSIDSRGRARITSEPPAMPLVHSPSADLLFESAAVTLGASVLGVLLTGMGRDGAQGLACIRRSGGFTIAEDESTAVVYGMPAVAEIMGAACVSLPVHEIAAFIRRTVADGLRSISAGGLSPRAGAGSDT